jgi:hypothetical protein
MEEYILEFNNTKIPSSYWYNFQLNIYFFGLLECM